MCDTYAVVRGSRVVETFDAASLKTAQGVVLSCWGTDFQVKEWKSLTNGQKREYLQVADLSDQQDDMRPDIWYADDTMPSRYCA